MPRVTDLAGQRFGRLIVIERSANKIDHYHTSWKCLCDCGAEKVIGSRHLRDGTTVSCGCFSRQQAATAFRTHGHASHGKTSPTYRSWHSMMMRCTNPNATGFEYWGGRGVMVCDRWLKFSRFLADMGTRPLGCTIDRHPDPHGNYEPGNCRWASFTAQTRNRPKSAARLVPEAMNGLLGFGA